MSSSAAVDAVVVGGGIIGLTTAWRLAQRGLMVTVIDPAPAQAATHAAAGMLAPVSEVSYGEELALRLGMESLRRFPAFVADLESATGQSVGLRDEGTLIVATDAGDRDQLIELHKFQTGLGLSATLLTSGECRALEPMLSPDVRCGLLAASDHSVDNRRLSAALLSMLHTSGVMMIGERVAAINVDGDAVTGVSLDSGSAIAAATVIVAAGPWSAELAGIPASSRPAVRPVKGQIMRLRAHSPVPLPDHSIRGLVNGREIYLIPRADGELVVGATVEELGFDITVRTGAVREMLRDARAVLPALDELELVEVIARLRPGSPDNAPSIGATSTAGLVVATGHYRNGILLAPVTADLVAAVVTSTQSAEDEELLKVVSPLRFQPAGVLQ